MVDKSMPYITLPEENERGASSATGRDAFGGESDGRSGPSSSVREPHRRLREHLRLKPGVRVSVADGGGRRRYRRRRSRRPECGTSRAPPSVTGPDGDADDASVLPVFDAAERCAPNRKAASYDEIRGEIEEIRSKPGGRGRTRRSDPSADRFPRPEASAWRRRSPSRGRYLSRPSAPSDTVESRTEPRRIVTPHAD